MRFHRRQKQVLHCFKKYNPKILICSGAKRAGKTYVLTFIFMAHVAKYEGQKLSFILGGASQASIRRNVLNDLEVLLGKEIKLNKENAFEMFGNTIYCFGGDKADSWKAVRGFTSAGAFLNEATALHDSFVKECISRCSYKGARVFMDTNPENPSHTVKVDYINNSGQRLENGQLNIMAFDFTLFDNTFLDPEYVESIVKSTPSGMFTNRDIYGLWVASAGVVYADFDEKENYISKDYIKDKTFKTIFAGVDFGWEHNGSISLIGETVEGEYIMLKEIAGQHKHIDWWINQSKQIIAEYGEINFYCDHARPDYINKMREAGIRAINARKDVLAGIAEIASLILTRKLKIIEENVNIFKTEIYRYVWKEGKDEPVKENDDVLDSLRYAIYSHIKYGIELKNKSRGKKKGGRRR